MTNNPYVWNQVEPRLFFGRDGLRSEMLTGLPGATKLSYGIAGGRRMGKSTLLRRIELDLRAGQDQWVGGGLSVIPVYVDGLQFSYPLEAKDVWSSIYEEIMWELYPERGRQQHQVDFDSFKSGLIQAVESSPLLLRFIILFDEIEPILANDWAQAFLDNWRALLTNTQDLSRYVTAVFVGAHEMSALQRDVGSPLRDALEWRHLRNLEFDGVVELCDEPIGIAWSNEFHSRLYGETGGHPMLAQYIMQHVCNDLEAGMAAIGSAADLFARLRYWQFQEWWVRYCPPTAQRVYARLPDNGGDASVRALTSEFGLYDANQAIDILQHVGLAKADVDRMNVRYVGEMFRRWYRSSGVVTDVLRHDPLLYVQLQAINPQAAEKYLAAWQMYQAALADYAGVVAQIRETLTIVLDCLAPEERVMAEPGFTLERDQQWPSRRQRVKFVARALYRREQERLAEVTTDYDMLEHFSDELGRSAASAYQSASGVVHGPGASRQQAYRILKQWDGLLARIVPAAGVE